MIDPMSSRPLPLPLPLPLLPRDAAASFVLACSCFAFSASSFACFSFLWSLQSDFWSIQSALWHAVLQYDTIPQPEHVLNGTPFCLGFDLHLPHKTMSSGGCGGCCGGLRCFDEDDDMAWACFGLGLGLMLPFVWFAFLFLFLLFTRFLLLLV